VIISPTSGFVVDAIGWETFYFLTFLIAIPGLILIVKLREIINIASEK